MKTEPNWNEAPEGATHYDSEYGVFCTEFGWFGWWGFCTENPKGWGSDRYIPRPTVKQQLTVPVVNQEVTTEEAACSKIEPTTWDGKGLPPIGTVCEIYMGNYHSDRRESGEVVKVLTVAKNSNGKNMVLVEVYGADGECDAINVQCLRPLRSERERWITEAKKASSDILSSRQLGQIYDAGLAKLPD